MANPTASHAPKTILLDKVEQRRRHSDALFPQDKAPLLILCLLADYTLDGDDTDLFSWVHGRPLIAAMPGIHDWEAQRPDSPDKKEALLAAVRAALLAPFADPSDPNVLACSQLDMPSIADSLELDLRGGRWTAVADGASHPMGEVPDHESVASAMERAHHALGALFGAATLSLPPRGESPMFPSIAEAIGLIESAGPGGALPSGADTAPLAAFMARADLALALPQTGAPAAAPSALSRGL